MHVLASLLAIQLALTPDDASQHADREISVAPLPPPTPAPASARWSTSDAVLDTLAKEAEAAAKAKSPLALGRLYRLWNMNKLLERPKRVEAALDAILAVQKADPLLVAHARELRAHLFMQAGKIAEAKQLVKSIGLVTEAMVIGPFENSAGEGHPEVYAPETEIRLDDPADGKAHPVRWRELGGLAELGAIELSALITPSNEATAYVLVAIEAAKPTRAALRTGSTDQLRVFLDGTEVYALDSRRTANLDQDAIPLQLEAGSSLLLVKTSWLSGAGRLLLRLTAPDGGALEGVAIKGDRTAIESARAASMERSKKKSSSAKPPAFAVTAVSDALEKVIAKAKGPELADALALRADLAAVLGLFDRRKLPTPPERDLEAAIRIDPSNPTMRFFYAHRAQDRDPTIAREELEAALVSDPGHVPSLYKLADMARSSGRIIEANQRLDEAIEKDRDFTPAIVARATLRFDNALDRELALLELAEVAARLPAASITGEVARMRRSLEDRAGAKRDARRTLDLDYTDPGARSILIGVALDSGDVKSALAELDATLALYPWQLHARLRKARLLAADPSRRKDAFAVLAEAKKLFPDSTEVPNLESELLLFDGDQKGALAALERSLELDPHQPEVRRHRGSLAGEQREMEDEYTVDAGALTKLPLSEDEQSWGAAYLADRTAIRLYENGQSSRFQQMVIRLANPNLKDSVRVQRVAYSPSREIVEILSADRIRPSGEVIKATSVTDDGESGKVGGMYLDRRFKTIVFDDLAKGDLLNIRYRIDSVGSNMFGSFFGDIVGLQGGLPKMGVLYTVIMPKARQLYWGKVRAKDPTVLEAGNLTRYTWSYDKIEALDVEPFSPPYPDIGMLVSVSTYKSWADLGKWYARLFSDSLELDAAARAGGKRAIAGAKDDAEKIRRLYDYVVKNTRYVGIELGIHGWKPFKASEVNRRRYGDCKDKATLLAALLRDNGIDATITLVRTADRGMLPTDHATMWAFNHAITYVPSQNLFLDGTAEFSGSNELPHSDQGAMSLIVFPDGTTKLVTLPESKAPDNLNSSTYQAVIGRNGALSLQGTERFHGARASALRQEFEEVEQRKTRLEKQLNQVFNGVHITELSFSDMSNLEAPVSYDYKAEIERYGVEENGKYIIPLTLFQHQVATAYGQLASRKYDLYSNHPWETRNVVRYELPKGAVLESLPDGVDIETPYIKLKQIVRRVPGGFETDDTVTLDSKRVPGASYADFRKACLAIDRALGRKVVIRW